ncbi:uncharacterized protein LOC130130891 [Lampris incognitus]|uniref:uncharacterized protein LOC130130891 n=1 Tax=Lampris incognitus TaxID=2546036 RepID=UPI0024B52CEA|nr:uncharacterized protein LOC130130891 [Lampris incognitus]
MEILTEWVHLSSGPFGWDTGERIQGSDTISLGLLLGGVCVGLPAIVMVLLSFCCKCAEPRNLTVFSTSLLFTALLQSLSTPVVAMQVMGSSCSINHCQKLVDVWFASRRSGMLLHLLVALEAVLSQKLPKATKKLRSMYWSLPVILTVDLICILFLEVNATAIGLGTVALVLTAMICIVSCLPPFCLDKRTMKVYAIAVMSLGVTYFPSFVMECMLEDGARIDLQLYSIFLCLTNLRLIPDAFLCWLLCRDPVPDQAPRTNTELENPGLEL